MFGLNFLNKTPSASISRTTTHRKPFFKVQTDRYNINATVIAGAGGAGNEGGGSGAGGMLEVTNEPILVGTLYTIQVGGGGAYDTVGVSSYFGVTSIAQGGGKGAAFSSGSAMNGGSGGGVSYNLTPAGAATQVNTLFGIGYGNAGGHGYHIEGGGGGGGGAAGAGSNASNSGYASGTGGNGGTSRASDIDGVQYCGGGGGGGSTNYGAAGGGGGGGAASGKSRGQAIGGMNGSTNSGSGAGSGSPHGPAGGGTGGSGIVILKIPAGDYSGTTTGSPNVDTTTYVGFVVLKYTGIGSYTG